MKQLHSRTDTLEVVDRKYRFTVMTVIPSIVVTLLITLFPSLNALVSLILLWTFPVAFYLLWNRADNRVIESYTVESVETPQWEQVESITVESLINYRSLIDFTESDDEVTILNELYKTNPNVFDPDNSSNKLIETLKVRRHVKLLSVEDRKAITEKMVEKDFGRAESKRIALERARADKDESHNGFPDRKIVDECIQGLDKKTAGGLRVRRSGSRTACVVRVWPINSTSMRARGWTFCGKAIDFNSNSTTEFVMEGAKPECKHCFNTIRDLALMNKFIPKK